MLYQHHYVGLILEGFELYDCTELEYTNTSYDICLMDIEFENTVQGIADMVYALNRD